MILLIIVLSIQKLLADLEKLMVVSLVNNLQQSQLRKKISKWRSMKLLVKMYVEKCAKYS